MKLLRLSTLLYRASSSECGLRNVHNVSSYSTRLVTAKPNYKGKQPYGSMNALYHRISPIGGPTESIVPILNQWVAEGRHLDREQLFLIVKEMRNRRRFSHALEISMWMSNKMNLTLTSRDHAVRLDLISKVRGTEQAENYFSTIPVQLRGLDVLGALLNCYAKGKCVEKAEVTMEKIRELDLARNPLVYNCLLSLYYQIGNLEKFVSLIHEMEEKGIFFDKFTFSLKLSMHAIASDIDGIDKTLAKMESNSSILDWTTYAAAASGYLKVGHLDKALAMLKKSEKLIIDKKSRTAYNFLISQYAACGKKEEVLRLWEQYKSTMKVYIKGYFSVMPSVLKFDDLESAERIFEELESQNLSHDIRIANFLIGAYCRKGLVQKAETLMDRVIVKGGKPDSRTWFYLANGYLRNNQTAKVVEAMNNALMIYQGGWKLNKECLYSCLIRFKDEKDMEGAEKFIKLLRDKEIISEDIEEKLCGYVQNSISNLNILSELDVDALVGNSNSSSIKLKETC